jgi:hypothetical protein
MIGRSRPELLALPGFLRALFPKWFPLGSILPVLSEFSLVACRACERQISFRKLDMSVVVHEPYISL